MTFQQFQTFIFFFSHITNSNSSSKTINTILTKQIQLQKQYPHYYKQSLSLIPKLF